MAPLPLWQGSTEARGSQLLLPLPHSFTLTSIHPDINSPTCSTTAHRPSGLPGKNRQAQHGVRAATSWILHHVVFLLPTRWAPWDEEHLDKAVSCQGCPKSGQPAQESAAFSVPHGSARGKSQENREPFVVFLSLIHCKLCC